MTDSNFMVEVIRKRRIECVIFTSDGSGKQRILRADPGRVYVKFRKNSSFAIPVPYPHSPPIDIAASVSMSEPEEYKFKDTAAMVVGEWYIFDTTPGNDMQILTETYIGD